MFIVLRRIDRYIIISTYIGLHVKYPLFLSDFNGTWLFSIEFGKKYWNIKFHENPPIGSRVISDGRIDRQDKANSRFSQFWERD
jgi:hypothetical protein